MKVVEISRIACEKIKHAEITCTQFNYKYYTPDVNIALHGVTINIQLLLCV